MSTHKKVFITGIAGFIGYHLAKALKAQGNHVIGCDNFNDYYDPALKRARAKELDLPILETDICDTTSIEKSMDGVTHFVHLAAQAGVRYSLTNPHSYVHSNLDGFVKILELLRKHPEVKLTYASSSSVYGLNTKTPFSESDITDSPASLYGATKKANELLAHSYHHLYGMHVTGLRFFTVYGPWGRPDMAYFSFTKKILSGEPIEVFNNGDVSRDFTYIDDIVSGIIAAIDLGAPCEVFNLGNNTPQGVLTLIEIIESLTQKKANKVMIPMQPGDVHTTFADITKSQVALGFTPRTSLQDGMQHFVDWYSANRDLAPLC